MVDLNDPRCFFLLSSILCICVIHKNCISQTKSDGNREFPGTIELSGSISKKALLMGTCVPMKFGVSECCAAGVAIQNVGILIHMIL